MRQRQKSTGVTTPQCDAAAQKGNSAAKNAADRANAALQATKPKQKKIVWVLCAICQMKLCPLSHRFEIEE